MDNKVEINVKINRKFVIIIPRNNDVVFLFYIKDLLMMANIEILSSIFDFFEMIVGYYKKLKKENKGNFKVPSRVNIGAVFGGMSSNYSRYKKLKRLPNIWGKNVSDEFIVNDIYKRLFNGGMIPQETLYQSGFVEYIDHLILNRVKNNSKIYNDNKSINRLLQDLKFFKENENYEQYIKCVIGFLNRKPGKVYLSRVKFDICCTESQLHLPNSHDWHFLIKPFRILPFDIGSNLDNIDMKNISDYLTGRYRSIKASKRRDKILCDSSIEYEISEFLELIVYDTGIGSFVIKEPAYIEKELEYFSVEYCKKRRDAHIEILTWKHTQSDKILEIIKHLRDIVFARHESIRKTADTDFECGGISYAMTISFFEVQGKKKQNLNWETCPDWIKKNIIVLLNPDIISMEDSLNFYQEDTLSQQDFCDILDNIDVKTPCIDYERRVHISTYASWAAVVVMGSFDESDIDEYVSLEIELQQKWFYLYCLEKILPNVSSVALNTEGAFLADVKIKNYELSVFEYNIKHIDDPNLPERVKVIKHALVETSTILDMLERYRMKLNFFIEMGSLRNNSNL